MRITEIIDWIGESDAPEGVEYFRVTLKKDIGEFKAGTQFSSALTVMAAKGAAIVLVEASGVEHAYLVGLEVKVEAFFEKLPEHKSR